MWLARTNLYSRCAATNPGFPISELRKSEPFHVNITFRPQHISIRKVNIGHTSSDLQPITSLTVTAGEMLHLECTAGPANPPVPLGWIHLQCESTLSPSAGKATNFTFYKNDPAALIDKGCSVLNKFSKFFVSLKLLSKKAAKSIDMIS